MEKAGVDEWVKHTRHQGGDVEPRITVDLFQLYT